MKIQLIRNATLRVQYGGRLFLIDPDLGDKHGREPLAGKSRNPTVGLPIPADEVINGVEMILISHLHQDHFDSTAQDMLPKDIPVFCQPEDEKAITGYNFENVQPLANSVEWEGINITRTAAQHGTGVWAERLGPVSGFVFRAEDEPTVYWCGDTILYPEVEKVIEEVNPDIVITHSGGAQLDESGPIIMEVEQTLEVCRAAHNAKVVAVHLEALDHCQVARVDLKDAAQAASLKDRLLIPKDGELISL